MSAEPPDEGRNVEISARRRRPNPATVAVTAGRPPNTPDGPLNTPVVFASALHPGGTVGYARDGNPTWTPLEEAVAALEGGGTGLAFASGMAAIAAVLDSLPPGASISTTATPAPVSSSRKHPKADGSSAQSTSQTPTQPSPPVTVPRCSGSSRRRTRSWTSRTSAPWPPAPANEASSAPSTTPCHPARAAPA